MCSFFLTGVQQQKLCFAMVDVQRVFLLLRFHAQVLYYRLNNLRQHKQKGAETERSVDVIIQQKKSGHVLFFNLFKVSIFCCW